MGFDLGKFLTNAGSLGTTYFRDQRRADDQSAAADALIAENTARAQALFDEDLGQSALAQIASDPEMIARQRDTLDRFGDLSRTGWSPTDRQALEAQNFQSRQEEQSQRQSVLDAAARRGDTSGGNALMAALSAQQGGANRASQRGTNIALEGRQRALDALANQGQMAGQMRGQQFSEDATRGGAMDQFRQWAAGERSARAQALANASLGQASNIAANADELRSSDTAMAIANGALNVYTAGLSGAATGAAKGAGSPGSTTGYSGAGSLSTSGTIDPVTGLAKSMPGTPAATTAPAQGAMQKGIAQGAGPQAKAATPVQPQGGLDFGNMLTTRGGTQQPMARPSGGPRESALSTLAGGTPGGTDFGNMLTSATGGTRPTGPRIAPTGAGSGSGGGAQGGGIDLASLARTAAGGGNVNQRRPRRPGVM